VRYSLYITTMRAWIRPCQRRARDTHPPGAPPGSAPIIHAVLSRNPRPAPCSAISASSQPASSASTAPIPTSSCSWERGLRRGDPRGMPSSAPSPYGSVAPLSLLAAAAHPDRRAHRLLIRDLMAGRAAGEEHAPSPGRSGAGLVATTTCPWTWTAGEAHGDYFLAIQNEYELRRFLERCGTRGPGWSSRSARPGAACSTVSPSWPPATPRWSASTCRRPQLRRPDGDGA